MNMKKIENELQKLLDLKAKYERVFKLRSEGWTLQAIADDVELSRQRVHQILTDPELRPETAE